ncbi:MAG: Branched-chain alpha-keto acid dehydrogenase subunit, partial [Microvirga sp.]|nr:Branched-chain alpha-keto acid dehydrogenase subunit [Microvirga sp.]
MKVELPFLAEGVEGGDVVQVLVQEGDQVTEGQSLIELETDKATVPVPAPAAGKITRLLVRKGDHLKVGQALVEVDGEGQPASQQTTETKTPPDKKPTGAKSAEKEPTDKKPTSEQPEVEPAPQPDPAVEAAHAKSVEQREKPPAQSKTEQ